MSGATIFQNPPLDQKKDRYGNGSGNGNGHVTAQINPTGFRWDRFFGNTNPYDDIQWETRTAKITKGDGTVVFEQKDVEVPAFWTQTATDIVASKYFRGQLGTPEREYSARQMVDRVAKTIGQWGMEAGYFAGLEDRDNFILDLSWSLINQYCAFNSPVWFNVGVHERPQCSACFILAVDDNMQSILDWYRDEGWIFKYGSGSGTNLSKLRSSKEPLSKGGYSSGPVSFMKGADGVANSIRSGGTTRRAAKMVVLNVDHPDIKDFIYCKKHIEDMSKILVANGIANSIEGDLFSPYTLLPYQNANNSVRVTDEFMQAVERDDMWELKAVKTGKPFEKIRAREVMNWIADAAWHSADPGMQYDTTINRWHTCSNTDRINASNPCVTGDTLVATDRGLRRIMDLVDLQPTVVSRDGFYKASRVWQTGIKPVYKLTTKYGYSVKVTDDHKFYVAGVGDVQAKDLKIGNLLTLRGAGFGNTSLEESLSMTVGYALGDGCISHKVTRGNPQLTLVGGDNDKLVLEQIAHSINVSSGHSDSMGRMLSPVHVFSTQTGLRVATSRTDVVFLVSQYAILDKESLGKQFTDEVFNLNKRAVAYMLKGLFTADGTVSGNGEKGFYVGLDSVSLTLLEQTQLLLLNFGIKAKIYKNRRRAFQAELPDAKRAKKIYPVQQMHSLRITRSGRILFEREIGFVLGTPKAEKLRNINKTSDAYKDELTDQFESLELVGIEPVFDLTEPETNHFVVNGLLAHNCSEYMHLDNSACNLASLNLLKFLKPDNSFDVQLYRKVVDTLILAQDILVDFSSYPTENITRNAKDYRELGLGYANLGALLMSMGFAYDSEEGRILAGQLTSLMCGEAYRLSAMIARIKGPYNGYAKNKDPQLNVIAMHRDEAEKCYSSAVKSGIGSHELQVASRMVWHEALELATKNGVRNSQMTVLAPTGTIAFLMDCDTTGVEPELALVKYKKLVGGGVLKLVNNQVGRALAQLGYNELQIKEITNHLMKGDTIEGAPHLRDEHLSIFDCSFKATNGVRSISWLGHLRMMAAAQPFISGAISKTINMPADATVEDVREAFMEGWRLGLKAIAIYRDGSKGVQPLNTSKDKKDDPSTNAQGQLNSSPNLVEKINGYTRVKLPDERPAITHKYSVGGYEGYLTVGLYPDTMKPGETFLVAAKEGSTVSGLLDTIATLISMCLQSGIPLKTLVKKFKDLSYAPAGFTNNPEIPMAKSITDYVFRYLGMKFLSLEEREEVFGPSQTDTLPEAAASVDAKNDAILASLASIPVNVSKKGETLSTQYDIGAIVANASAPVCQCGALMFRAGSCYSCPNCFATTGVCN